MQGRVRAVSKSGPPRPCAGWARQAPVPAAPLALANGSRPHHWHQGAVRSTAKVPPSGDAKELKQILIRAAELAKKVVAPGSTLQEWIEHNMPHSVRMFTTAAGKASLELYMRPISAPEFFASLPSHSFTTQEVHLRTVLVALLENGPSSSTQLKRNPQLLAAQDGALPRSVQLQEWVERRIGQDVTIFRSGAAGPVMFALPEMPDEMFHDEVGTAFDASCINAANTARSTTSSHGKPHVCDQAPDDVNSQDRVAGAKLSMLLAHLLGRVPDKDTVNETLEVEGGFQCRITGGATLPGDAAGMVWHGDVLPSKTKARGSGSSAALRWMIEEFAIGAAEDLERCTKDDFAAILASQAQRDAVSGGPLKKPLQITPAVRQSPHAASLNDPSLDAGDGGPPDYDQESGSKLHKLIWQLLGRKPEQGDLIYEISEVEGGLEARITGGPDLPGDLAGMCWHGVVLPSKTKAKASVASAALRWIFEESEIGAGLDRTILRKTDKRDKQPPVWAAEFEKYKREKREQDELEEEKLLEKKRRKLLEKSFSVHCQ